ncbi:GNAT family acetyltransferase [Aquimarina sp. U1-2]|uniref:GNAT family acetyltransferase n=1 Tax=Aquimarina sp. U1-2 TaxID=2823141 RepID=UPI001AECD3D9|nr:GNAT family acetyltransferase [Aquimarina sp. U1-2]MBP2834111.1 GNAT family acetyltransferase [Aquimarina sp. U1-2]
MINTRIGNKSDIQGVLQLQEKNLYANLTTAERQRGFVTTPFTKNQIEDIIEQNGLFVAQHDQNIVAYTFAGSWQYFNQWEIFNHMISCFPHLRFMGKNITTENSFQYGPVCIDSDYRGKGLLPSIFETMRVVFQKHYPISITFINKINTVSEKAHTQKLGWTVIDTFTFNNNQYCTLAFDMNNSVLKSC